jgi:hypothetical protein
MIQPRRGACFALETRTARRIRSRLAQSLDRDGAFEAIVDRPVHHAHPPFTESAGNTVTAEAFAHADL